MAKKLKYGNTEIRWNIGGEGDFICLTDMVRNRERPTDEYIRNWMRATTTLEFLAAWERENNTGFKEEAFSEIKMAYGRNDFMMTVGKWATSTKAIGVKSVAGRGGGTFAHSHIAIHFANWLSPEFYVWIIREFERLKIDEAAKLNQVWNVRRELARANFHIHTEAVRQFLVPIIDWRTKKEAIYQASESDVLNLALFGMTAREWKVANPNLAGNMRDHATPEQLLILANLESLNSKLIAWNCDKDERLRILNETAKEQSSILQGKRSVAELKKHMNDKIKRLKKGKP